MGVVGGLPKINTKPTPAVAAINSQRVTHATRPDDPDINHSIQVALYRAEAILAFRLQMACWTFVRPAGGVRNGDAFSHSSQRFRSSQRPQPIIIILRQFE
jgi:hypothetical protein